MKKIIKRKKKQSQLPQADSLKHALTEAQAYSTAPTFSVELRSSTSQPMQKLNFGMPAKAMPRLIQAVQAKDADLVEALLKKGDNINALGDAGWTAAHVAAFEGQYDILKQLIEHKAAEIQDDRNWTPFYFAVSKGDIPIARLLLEHGASINRSALIDTQGPALENLTPLEYAILQQDLKMTGFLLQQGAKFDKPNEGDTISIAIQAFNKSIDIKAQVKMLDIICLLIHAGVYTGENKDTDLLNHIEEPAAQKYAKAKREAAQDEALRFLKHRAARSIRKQPTVFSLPILRFRQTRFILQHWHPYLLSFFQHFQSKLSHLPSSNPASDKFLQALLQFKLIVYLKKAFEDHKAQKSLGSSIPLVFKKQPDIDNINNYHRAIKELYQEYLPPSERILTQDKSEAIIQCLRHRTWEQINAIFKEKWYDILHHYTATALGKRIDRCAHYIKTIYTDANPELQNELMRGFLGNGMPPSPDPVSTQVIFQKPA